MSAADLRADDDLIALQCTYCPDCGGGCRVDPEAAEEAITTARDWAQRAAGRSPGAVSGEPGGADLWRCPAPRPPAHRIAGSDGSSSDGTGGVGGLAAYRTDTPGGDVDGKRW